MGHKKVLKLAQTLTVWKVQITPRKSSSPWVTLQTEGYVNKNQI